MKNNEIDHCSAPLHPREQHDNVITLTSGNRESPKQVDVQFTNLQYSVPLKKGQWKDILRGVTGEFHSGRLTAILGPSGAGKTTFLHLLASRGSRRTQRCMRGELRFNGATVQEQPDIYRSASICYVPQEFALLPLLTVRETIRIAAELKLPTNRQDSRSMDFIVEDVAQKLSLEDCLETLTNKLSGGEKKRLSIAVEMITSPSVMLLDEPTSGLDSTSSAQVISLLFSMARTGCTVVCTVHQPSSKITCSFDDLLIMNRGASSYFGPRERILDYFRAAGYECPPFYNLAEFVLEVVSGQRGGNFQLISNAYTDEGVLIDAKESTCSTTPSSDEVWDNTGRYAVSYLKQLKVLLRRAFICIGRDNTLTTLRLSAHLIVAILLGVVYYNFGQDARKIQSNIACIFFFAIFLFFANSMPSVQIFPPEAEVFLREKTNNWYSLEIYYVAKVLSDIPLQIICPTGFLAIAYYMTGQPLEVIRFFEVWLICTLFTILSQSFGIVTGAAFNTHAGMFLVPALNIPMLLFAGFFLKLKEIPGYLQFLSSISYFRYVYEGLLQAIYMDRPKIPCSIDFCYIRTTKQILDELDMPSVPYSTTVIALCAWIIVLHCLIYGVLRWKLYVARG